MDFRSYNKLLFSRFFVVGVIGNLIGLAIYAAIFSIVQYEPRAAISWFLSSIVGIWKQHGLHRIFTFTDSREDYLRSLIKAYLSYSFIIASGTICHWSLVSILGVYHYYSWLITQVIHVAISFLILRRFVFKPNSDNSESEE